jgi:hypothetical protein
MCGPLPPIIQGFEHYFNVGARVLKVYDGTSIDDLFLDVVGMGDSKHVSEDFGVEAQDATVDAEVVPLDGDDDVAIV